MDFKTCDYLTLTNIETLINEPNPHKKAALIANKLKNYCCLHQTKLFVLQKNTTYKQSTMTFENILSKTTELIGLSYDNLHQNDQRLIKSEHSKTYKSIFTNADVKKYYEELLLNLCNDDIQFDTTLCEIHFNNGYIDLKTNEFKQRDISKHYVSKYINRDYVQSASENRASVIKLIKKIYPDKKDLDCLIHIIGSSLSGLTLSDQEIVFLLGQGNSGKSTIMKTTSLSIECYFKELQSNVFSQGNSKIDKILNSYCNDSQVRISWINEMEGKKIDDTLFKKFCEGELQTTKLFKENQHLVKHFSKCMVTSNEMPNFRVDTGMTRRIKAYTHQSKFVKTKDEVKESENIYLEDSNFLSKMNNDIMLNAWIDILAAACKLYIAGQKTVFTDNFKDTKSDIMSGNDFFQDFIDSSLIVTNVDKERISKDHMRGAFLNKYPDKHMTVSQVMTSLRDKGIVYNSKYRCDNVQGCYVGIKFRERNAFVDDDDDDPLDHGLEEQNTIKQLREEIKLLKAQMTKIESIKPKKTKTKNKTKHVEVVADILEENDEDENCSGLEMIMEYF
jgi:hypothetical protein